MSEPEKKGSPWPWFLVPVAAISLFFVLRQCRQNLPPAEHAPTTAVAPATTTPVAAVAAPATVEAAPASIPAP
jgi:hypothetical protein